jgi:hypothetical protein
MPEFLDAIYARHNTKMENAWQDDKDELAKRRKGVVPDGSSVRVPFMMMDHAKPADNSSVLADTKAARDAFRNAIDEELFAARGGNPFTQAPVTRGKFTDEQIQRQQETMSKYEARLTNAWRT